jgi:glycosyltransferase involved in cell wall biosynthesis/prenyltransferase beta subunit
MRSPAYLLGRAVRNGLSPAALHADVVALLQSFRRPQRSVSRETALAEAAAWLTYMRNADAGFSSHYSLLFGREGSFPEVTGYIIPTLLALTEHTNDTRHREHARQAGAWLLAIQSPDGSFPSYTQPGRPLVFDAGQIIFGMLALYALDNDERYLDAAKRAGDWIVAQQDERGFWQKHAYNDIPHTYYSRTSWGLLELWKITHDERYKTSAARQLDWVLAQQQENGSFKNCSFSADGTPALHVIAYTIEGLLQAGRILHDERYASAARKAADALRTLNHRDRPLFGFYDADWHPRSTSRCLTGLAQMSVVFSWLYEDTKEVAYLREARTLNRFLRDVQFHSGPGAIRGALAGSFPVSGRYMQWSFPSWAAKFWIDALLLEIKHGEEALSVVAFPIEPLANYIQKGEIKKDYWDPARTFSEVHVLELSDNTYSDAEKEKLQLMAGGAKLFIHQISTEGARPLLHLGRFSAKITNLLRELQPDVVRAHGLFANGYFAHRAARALHMPFIVSLHTNYRWDIIDLTWRHEHKYLKAFFYFLWHLFIQRGILRGADKIIAVYPFAAAYALEQGIPPERIETIYNHIYGDVFYRDPAIPKNDRFTILDVGRLIVARNQETLIRALASLPNAELVLIGQGPEEARLKTLAAGLKLTDRVTFIAKVDNQELRAHYNRAHVYATPNRFGGVEISVIEAMACGLPIVTSKHKSEAAPDLTGMDNCLYVENTVEGFRNGIQQLMEDKALYNALADKSLALYDAVSGARMEQREHAVYLGVL